MFRKRGQSAASKRKRKFLITLGCIVGGILALLPVSYFWLLSWLQGDGFRGTLEEKLSNKTKAEVTIPAPLQLDGCNVELPGVKLHGTTFLKEAEVTGIKAEINRSELFDRCLHAPLVSIRNLRLRMDTRKEAPGVYPDDEAGFLSRFTPNRYLVDRIECTNTEALLNIRRSDSGKKPYRYELRGSTFVASPISGQENAWQVKLRNGTLSTSHRYLAKSSLRHAILHYADDTVTLSECQLALTKGNMDATGSFHVKKKDWSLSVGVGNADVERLLSESWQEILTGEFSGNLKMSGKGQDIRSADGHLSLRKGRFRALSFVLRYLGSGDRADMAIKIPGQQAATDYLEDTFKLIEISRADCNIRFPHTDEARDIEQAWLFDSLDIRTKKDELRLMGHIIIEQDGSLHGTISIGINENNINEFIELTTEPIQSLIRAGINKLLNAEGPEGFRWVNINLSGTSDAPQQDFSVRVQKIMQSLSADAILNTAAETVKSGLDVLPFGPKTEEKDAKQPTKGDGTLLDAAEDTANQIIDTGMDVIPFL